MTTHFFAYKVELTKVAGKIRIKERQTFSEYGLPIAPTKVKISNRHYVEWQIGYDVVSNKEDFHFVGANGKNKKLFELSGIVRDFYCKGIIVKEQIQDALVFVENNQELVEDVLEINRTLFKPKKIAQIDFLKAEVSYPLLVYRFCNQDSISEIIIKEKQFAVGIQAMLYFCFPVSILYSHNGIQDFVGRTIQSKEFGYLRIDRNNIFIFLEMLKIFGILSSGHRHDVIEIFKYILRSQFSF